MKTIRIYFEGDDDKAILEGLDEAGLLPQGVELAKRDKGQNPGKDGLIRQLIPFVHPTTGVGGNAIVLVDLDDLNIDKLTVWFHNQLKSQLQAPVTCELADITHPRLRPFRVISGNEIGNIVLCPVGLPDDATLRAEYILDRFAIDEYLLRLVRHGGIYSAVTDFSSLPHATAMHKLTEVGKLFRDNGIDVSRSKTYMQILRAAAQIRPATATIAKRLVSKGAKTIPGVEFRELLSPLLDDIHNAVELLIPDSATS